ncbi:hypothetical protein U1Q18_034794 [Sarracenia purpurea var. burkii]
MRIEFGIENPNRFVFLFYYKRVWYARLCYRFGNRAIQLVLSVEGEGIRMAMRLRDCSTSQPNAESSPWHEAWLISRVGIPRWGLRWGDFDPSLHQLLMMHRLKRSPCG